MRWPLYLPKNLLSYVKENIESINRSAFLNITLWTSNTLANSLQECAPLFSFFTHIALSVRGHLLCFII